MKRAFDTAARPSVGVELAKPMNLIRSINSHGHETPLKSKEKNERKTRQFFPWAAVWPAALRSSFSPSPLLRFPKRLIEAPDFLSELVTLDPEAAGSDRGHDGEERHAVQNKVLHRYGSFSVWV
jgi:hypothetical protein